MDLKKECITVSIRIRPQVKNNETCLQVISEEPPVLAMLDRPQAYHFDHIFSEDVKQVDVYDETVRPLVDYVKQGYNCTVFAYGQTGTGKTYTMGTDGQEYIEISHIGIIPRVLNQIFTENFYDNNETIDVRISFVEIYNEKVFDLLQPHRKSPLPVAGFGIQELAIKPVDNVEEAITLLQLGSKNRHIAETKQNMNSSRSHAIFTVYFTIKNSIGQASGKLNLVDLAGSESVRKTQTAGATFKEGVNINKGLLSIGQVISALSMKSTYIPYRQSMITSILQGSLNVDNHISLIACVSSSSDDITETLQTLDFSQRAKKIKSNPEVNQIILKYKKEQQNSNRTPLKRMNNTPLKTPAKKMAIFSMPLINESVQSQNEYSKNQVTLCSSVNSMISNNTNITQEMLSPVIRKYVTKMEASLMGQLEMVIKKNLQRPLKDSPLAMKLRDKENTPSLPWNKIQIEVSKLVRSEMAQLTARTERATSSPIEFNETKIKRVLNYDGPETLNSLELATNNISYQVDDQFKVPVVPLPKKRNQTKLSISPIETEHLKATPRRSVRLSKKHVGNNQSTDMIPFAFNSTFNSDQNDTNVQTLNDVSVILPRKISPTFTPRRSRRLTQKRAVDTISKAECINLSTNLSVLNAEKRLDNIKRTAPITVKTKSSRNQNKRKNHTPKNKQIIGKSKSKTSPFTLHYLKVLSILNEGDLRDMQTLHSIGQKTGEQIILYRNLKGQFSKIDDLSKVPGWGTKKYERFMFYNLLQK